MNRPSCTGRKLRRAEKKLAVKVGAVFGRIFGELTGGELDFGSIGEGVSITFFFPWPAVTGGCMRKTAPQFPQHCAHSPRFVGLIRF